MKVGHQKRPDEERVELFGPFFVGLPHGFHEGVENFKAGISKSINLPNSLQGRLFLRHICYINY